MSGMRVDYQAIRAATRHLDEAVDLLSRRSTRDRSGDFGLLNGALDAAFDDLAGTRRVAHSALSEFARQVDMSLQLLILTERFLGTELDDARRAKSNKKPGGAT